MKEIKRIKNIREFPYETNCIKCGRNIKLFYNGGELDSTKCCGIYYELNNNQIDFVIKE